MRLDWQSMAVLVDSTHSQCLLTSLSEQQTGGLFCDITIVVEDAKFRAHRNVLAASSGYFQNAFSSTTESGPPSAVFELLDLKADTFASILHFIYTSTVAPLDAEGFQSLVAAGKRLGIPFLESLRVQNDKSSIDITQVSNPSQTQLPSRFSLMKQEVSDCENSPRITNAFSVTEGADGRFSLSSLLMQHDGDKESNKVSACCSKEASPQQMNVQILQDHTYAISPIYRPVHLSKAREIKEQQEVRLSNTPPPKHGGSIPVCGTYPTARACSPAISSLPPKGKHKTGVSSGATRFTSQSDTRTVCTVSASSVHSSSHTITTTATTVSSNNNPNSQNNIAAAFTVSSLFLNSNSQIRPESTVSVLSSDSNSHRNILEELGVVNSTPALTSEAEPLNCQSQDNPQTTGEEPAHCVQTQICASHLSCRFCHRKFINLKWLRNHEQVCWQASKPLAQDTLSSTSTRSAGEDTQSMGEVVLSAGHSRVSDLVVPLRNVKQQQGWKRKYYCSVCMRTYVTLSSLKRHENVHSWRKAYPCHYCNKVFALAEHRTKHEIWHTGERRYQCTFCSETFMTYNILKKHQKCLHGIDQQLLLNKKSANCYFNTSKLYRLLPMKFRKKRNTYSHTAPEAMRHPSQTSSVRFGSGFPLTVLDNGNIDTNSSRIHVGQLVTFMATPKVPATVQPNFEAAEQHQGNEGSVHGSITAGGKESRADRARCSKDECSEGSSLKKTAVDRDNAVRYIAKPACAAFGTGHRASTLCHITVKIGTEAVVHRRIKGSALFTRKRKRTHRNPAEECQTISKTSLHTNSNST